MLMEKNKLSNSMNQFNFTYSLYLSNKITVLETFADDCGSHNRPSHAEVDT
jgi:hypothetical protein